MFTRCPVYLLRRCCAQSDLIEQPPCPVRTDPQRLDCRLDRHPPIGTARYPLGVPERGDDLFVGQLRSIVPLDRRGGTGVTDGTCSGTPGDRGAISSSFTLSGTTGGRTGRTGRGTDHP